MNDVDRYKDLKRYSDILSQPGMGYYIVFAVGIIPVVMIWKLSDLFGLSISHILKPMAFVFIIITVAWPYIILCFYPLKKKRYGNEERQNTV